MNNNSLKSSNIFNYISIGGKIVSNEGIINHIDKKNSLDMDENKDILNSFELIMNE
jgi:hypothetical protein